MSQAESIWVVLSQKKIILQTGFQFFAQQIFFFTYKAYILSRIKRVIFFNKSKFALKKPQII